MATAPRISSTHGFITVVRSTNGRTVNMSKVWLVWQGYYSDKGVIAVFDNEKDAEVHAAMTNNDCYITEHEVGKIEYPADIKIGYDIKVCYIDGKYAWHDVEGYVSPISAYKRKPNLIYEYKSFLHHDCYAYRVVVVSDSKEKAVKIAQDLVAQYRAEKLGL